MRSRGPRRGVIGCSDDDQEEDPAEVPSSRPQLGGDEAERGEGDDLLRPR